MYHELNGNITKIRTLDYANLQHTHIENPKKGDTWTAPADGQVIVNSQSAGEINHTQAYLTISNRSIIREDGAYAVVYMHYTSVILSGNLDFIPVKEGDILEVANSQDFGNLYFRFMPYEKL